MLDEYRQAIQNLYGEEIARESVLKVEVAWGRCRIMVGIPERKPDGGLNRTMVFLPLDFAPDKIPPMIEVLKRRYALVQFQEKIKSGEIDLTKEIPEEREAAAKASETQAS